METFKEYFEEELKKANIVRLYRPINDLLQKELSDSKIASPYNLFEVESLEEVKEKYDFDKIFKLMEDAISIQKMLVNSEIQEYYINNMYRVDNSSLYELKSDIETIYPFICKIVKYRYGKNILSKYIDRDVMLSILSEYRKDVFCDNKLLSVEESIRSTRRIYKRLTARIEGASLYEIVECYITFTFTDITDENSKEIKSSIIKLLLDGESESIIELLFNNRSLLLCNRVYEGDTTLLASLSKKISDAYTLLT